MLLFYLVFYQRGIFAFPMRYSFLSLMHLGGYSGSLITYYVLGGCHKDSFFPNRNIPLKSAYLMLEFEMPKSNIQKL